MASLQNPLKHIAEDRYTKKQGSPRSPFARVKRRAEKEEREQKATRRKGDGHREIVAHVEHDQRRCPPARDRRPERNDKRARFQVHGKRHGWPGQPGVFNDPRAQQAVRVGLEQALGDVHAECAGREGVGLQSGELVERPAELAETAHRVGQQDGRAAQPEDQENVLAQGARRARRRPLPAVRQEDQQQGDKQRQVVAVADLAVGVFERDVLQQPRKRQDAGRSPAWQGGGEEARAEEKEEYPLDGRAATGQATTGGRA